MDGSGYFIITWLGSQFKSFSDIFAQRYESSGLPIGSEFRVNTYLTGSQTIPHVSMNNMGDFIIVWQSGDQDGPGDGIFAQKYDYNGRMVGGEFQVNAYNQNDQLFPSVDMNDDGNYILVWTSKGQDGSGDGIYAKLFQASTPSPTLYLILTPTPFNEP